MVLAQSRLCCWGCRGVGQSPGLGPLMTGDMPGVWGRDWQDETAKGGGGITSSTPAGRREVLSRHSGAAELGVPFANSPRPGGAVLAPPRAPHPGGVRLGMLRPPAQPMVC